MTSRLVYSTDGGRAPEERAPKSSPRNGRGSQGLKAPVPEAPEDGWLRVWRVKGGRGGKTATVVTGVPRSDLERLAVELRRFVGAGGGVREDSANRSQGGGPAAGAESSRGTGAIEVQGDHRERLQKRLTDLGYRVKLAGG